MFTRTRLNITLYVHCLSGLPLVGVLFPTVPVYSCVDNLVLSKLNPRYVKLSRVTFYDSRLINGQLHESKYCITITTQNTTKHKNKE
jgi:hypothetical protein